MKTKATQVKKTEISPLLIMTLPPKGNEWLGEYCESWRSLLEAQKKVCEMQMELLAAQEKMLAGFESRLKRRRSKAVGEI